MLSIRFLGSGSKGNAALLRLGSTYWLLDAGLSCRRIEKHLTELGLSLHDVAGVFLTHDHGDHVNGLATLLRRRDIPVYATPGTASSLVRKGLPRERFIMLRREQELELDGTRIWPFRVPHDAPEPVGYRFERAGQVLGLATDLGQVTAPVLAHLTDCDILCLESNYDEEMLAVCSYPDWLKSRIRSPLGHLPNQGVRGILSRLQKPLRNLLLVHVSEESNTPHLVRENLAPLLDHPCLARTRIVVASQNEPTSSAGLSPYGIRQPLLSDLVPVQSKAAR